MTDRPRSYEALALDQRDLTSADIHDDVPDRLFSASLLAGLVRIVQGSVEQDGWDRPHAFGFIRQPVRTPVGEGPVHALLLEWQPMDQMDELLRTVERPHHAVLHLARTLRTVPERLRSVLLDGTVGVGLLTEAWMLDASAMDQQDAKRASEARTIYQHPDRIEVKTLAAVDLNGVRYGVLHPRSGPLQPQRQAGTHRGLVNSGEVPDSLHYLMEALQRTTLPDYPAWQRALDAERPPEMRL